MSQILKLNRISAPERRFNNQKGMILGDLPSIEDIFVTNRSYDFILHTQPAQGWFFHFWAPKCRGSSSDHPLTSWSHRFSPW